MNDSGRKGGSKTVGFSLHNTQLVYPTDESYTVTRIEDGESLLDSTLVISGSEVFQKVQRAMRKTKSLDFDPKAREKLRELYLFYQSLIFSHADFLASQRPPGSPRNRAFDDDEERQNEEFDSPERWKLYFWMWHLSGIVFQINNKRHHIRDSVVSWLNQETNALNDAIPAHEEFLEIVEAERESERMRSAERIDKRLIDLTFVCLAHGNLRFVLDHIEHLSDLYSGLSVVLKEVHRVTKNMPEYSTLGDHNRLKSEHEKWKAGCLNLSKGLSDPNLSDLRDLVLVLSGDKRTITQRFKDNPIHATFASLAFCDPLITNLSCREMINEGLKGSADLRHKGLVACLSASITQVIDIFARSRWVVLHFFDFLSHTGWVSDYETGTAIRQHCIKEYATSLFSSKELWQIGCLYLKSVPGSQHFIAQLLDRIEIDSEKKAVKVINVYKQHNLEQNIEHVYKLLARQTFAKARNPKIHFAQSLSLHLQSLSYYIKARDYLTIPSLVSLIYALLVSDSAKSHESASLLSQTFSYISNLPDLVGEESLVFIKRFANLQRLQSENELRSVKEKLIEMVSEGLVPDQYKFPLLRDFAIPLLSQPIRFSSDDILVLMSLLQELSFLNEYSKEETLPTESKQVEKVRLALTKQLSSAFIGDYPAFSP